MSGHRRLATAVAVALAVAPRVAAADGPLVVTGPRIELAELVPNAPEALRDLDVGPAPPPGGTALLDRDGVLSQLRSAGADPKTISLPKLLRVIGASRRWSPPEVTAFVRDAVEAALPRGVTLTHLEAKMPLVAAPDAAAGHAEVPKPPKHAGPFRTAVIVPIVTGGQVAARVTVMATLDVSDAAARPDVARGSRVTLVIDRRSARIGAAGIALADADVGDVGEFRVDKTGRVVRARLDATDLAMVISP
jgi:Chaperone for flagella basal body P-ring formation